MSTPSPPLHLSHVRGRLGLPAQQILLPAATPLKTPARRLPGALLQPQGPLTPFAAASTPHVATALFGSITPKSAHKAPQFHPAGMHHRGSAVDDDDDYEEDVFVSPQPRAIDFSVISDDTEPSPLSSRIQRSSIDSLHADDHPFVPINKIQPLLDEEVPTDEDDDEEKDDLAGPFTREMLTPPAAELRFPGEMDTRTPPRPTSIVPLAGRPNRQLQRQDSCLKLRSRPNTPRQLLGQLEVISVLEDQGSPPRKTSAMQTPASPKRAPQKRLMDTETMMECVRYLLRVLLYWIGFPRLIQPYVVISRT